jgi:hypothetical protein
VARQLAHTQSARTPPCRGSPAPPSRRSSRAPCALPLSTSISARGCVGSRRSRHPKGRGNQLNLATDSDRRHGSGTWTRRRGRNKTLLFQNKSWLGKYLLGRLRQPRSFRTLAHFLTFGFDAMTLTDFPRRLKSPSIRLLGDSGAALVIATTAWLAAPPPSCAAPINYVFVDSSVALNGQSEQINGTFTYDPATTTESAVTIKLTGPPHMPPPIPSCRH